MKKKCKSFSFLWCISLLILTSCAPRSEMNTDTIRIGVSLYAANDTFVNSIVQNLERQTREMENQWNCKINLSILDANKNQTDQVEDVKRMISQKVDVLFINLVDRTEAAFLIDLAREADIPVVFFNRQPVDEDIKRWEKVYYVGANGEEAGQMQGELVRDLWQEDSSLIDKNGDEKIQYIMLEGEQKHQDTLLRTQCSIRALVTTNIKVEKLFGKTANWNRGEACDLMLEYLKEHGEEVEVIFCNNDDMALGVIDAYSTLGQEEIPIIVGIDGTNVAIEAIEAGKMYGTIYHDSYGIASALLEITGLLYQEDFTLSFELANNTIMLPHKAVTKE